jgi:tetratricopeptide (TPR) repeat protein
MTVRVAGLAAALGYSALIIWLYGAQPQSVAEVRGGLTASIGAYKVDGQAMADGLAFFRKDQFVEARAAFERADPARRDPTVQFYIAYSFYRQGWGRLYSDNALFREGLEAVDRAIAAAPGGRVVVDDPDLGMQSADELRAELERGLKVELSDFNPFRVFRPRK